MTFIFQVPEDNVGGIVILEAAWCPLVGLEPSLDGIELLNDCDCLSLAGDDDFSHGFVVRIDHH